MEHLIAPAIFCFEDMQNYDELTFILLKAIIKNFSRLYFICLVRDQNNESFIQEDIFTDGIEKLKDSIGLKKFNSTIISNLKHTEELDEFE